MDGASAVPAVGAWLWNAHPNRGEGRKGRNSEQHRGGCFIGSWQWFGLALCHLPIDPFSCSMNLNRHWVQETIVCCAQPTQARDAAEKNFALYKCFSHVKGKAEKGSSSLIACWFHTTEQTDYCLCLPRQLNPSSDSRVNNSTCLQTKKNVSIAENILPQIILWRSCWPKALVLLNPRHWKCSIPVWYLCIANQQKGCDRNACDEKQERWV